MTDLWNEANGGLRGSTFLRIGGAAYLIAALLHFSARMMVPDATGPDDPFFVVALLAWDFSLFLLAAGFFWTGINPFMSRFGIGLGLFITAQAVFLLIALVTSNVFPIPPATLTVGRTLLMAVFALVERKHLGRWTALALGLASALQFLRVFLRVMEIFPPLDMPWDAVVSTLIMVITAGAVYSVGNAVRRHEESWALANAPLGPSQFKDFNNPHHDWNGAPTNRKPVNQK